MINEISELQMRFELTTLRNLNRMLSLSELLGAIQSSSFPLPPKQSHKCFDSSLSLFS